MKNYVVGFLFDVGLQHVVLIRKNRPEWQSGCLNGVGGHIEDGESPHDAMVREFREETGVTVNEWRGFCDHTWESGARVHFFVAKGNIAEVQTTTNEEIVTIAVSDLYGWAIVSNFVWLIHMAIECHDHGYAYKVHGVF